MDSPAAPRSTRQLRQLEFMFVGAGLVLLTVGFPLLNAHGWLSDFTITLWGKYLCYALLAISVDLLWGYTGLLSLGQALFFSLGGYMFGMYLMLQIGMLGSYAKAGQNDRALLYIRKALEEGFKEKEKFEKEPEFAALKTNEDFRKLMVTEQKVL